MVDVDLIKKCNNIIDEIIAKEFREEARLIIGLTTNKERQEFIKYYTHDQGNLCCLVLDFAKNDLINQNKLVFNVKDGFGKPL